MPCGGYTAAPHDRRGESCAPGKPLFRALVFSQLGEDARRPGRWRRRDLARLQKPEALLGEAEPLIGRERPHLEVADAAHHGDNAGGKAHGRNS